MASTALIVGIILVFIGIIMLIIGIVMYSQHNNCNKSGQLSTDPPSTCWWVWFLIIGGIIFLILGIIMMIWGWSEGPPPPPLAPPMYVAGPAPQRLPQPLPQVIHHVYDQPQQTVQYVQAPPQQYEQGHQPPPHPPGPGSIDVTQKVGEQRQVSQQVSTTPIYQTTHTDKVLHTGPTTVSQPITTGVTTATVPQQVVVQRPINQPQL